MIERDLHPGQILWRNIVTRSRDSKAFLVGLMGACIVVPWAVAEGFMWGAKRNQAKLKEELRHAPFNMTEEVTSANKERIEQLFDDIKYKRNLSDRYLKAKNPPRTRGKTTTVPEQEDPKL
ncbi:uncharacterized protein LOC112347095 [Selaginella moellendorffii]|uniref:uncharacterized protein LOC112347095 n=1 Tax=Selaginella moellendorffii TaxID=88036 RepID=UPI000D1CEB62|nr:uncharacterized protein LOC112347095 [Selaginella moellendorffii]|eukprot:XP_024533186.1 uncharacterized protein LOC112347095 [Selaginella moellendorffii]